ncbi:hypothetical protein F5887DRAFT_965708 [Amanita rubescens]|nr:hypothetical protein F5887DRAFT_965708 [Amanita rubescens]
MAQVYACPCLNVHLVSTAPPPHPPDLPQDDNFTQLYVADDGIRVAHPHLTLRTRTRGVPIDGTSRCARYTTLTCLVCEALVYRVYQVVPIDIQGKEGPLLPTEDWVEDEIMKSSTGWIQVGNQCLVDDAVQAVESNPDYSPLFSVVLPKLSSPPSPAFQVAHDVVTARSPPSPQPPTSYLEKMKPFLPPAPFTPSHPVFVHLADTAVARSNALRAEAEEYIFRIVKERMDQVEKAEDEIRDQVKAIWVKFKTTVDAIKKEKEKPKASVAATWGGGAVAAGQELPAADAARSLPVAIKEFVPVAMSESPARALSPPRISALSASLATSSFHHPRALSESNGSNHSRSSHSSERSGSATLIHPPSHRELGANVLQFPRNIDDMVNTAVSFKYFVDLEYEMKRKKKERLEEVNKGHRARGRSDAGPSSTSSSQVPVKPSQERAELQVRHVQVDTEGSVVETSEKSPSKGKRHVTFDVEPEVVTIDGEAKKPEAGSSQAHGQDLRADMIFELEDTEGEEGAEPSSNGPPQILPLLEQPPARPVRHRKVKSLSNAGLPSSFSSLRPLSLPGPSQIRPPRSPHGIDASSQNVMMSLPKQTTLDQQKRLLSAKHTTLMDVPEEELDPRDAVILRLVAADTPSHRGAWRPDSEAWKSLTQPLGKGRGSTDVSEDEGEGGLALGPSEQSGGDEEYYLNERFVGVPGSLPIPIAPISKQKRVLSLASYQPDGTIMTVPSLVSKHAVSAAALRRASYAERDRQRAMDPGALDFATEDDEEEGESSEDEVDTGAGAGAGASLGDVEAEMGTRSRRRALRILQKRSEIPEEGMWRSLAA